MKHLAGKFLACLLISFMSMTSKPTMADTYIVAVGAASHSLQGRSAERFSNELQKRFIGEHKVVFFANGELGDEMQLLQKLQTETVHFTLISSVMVNVTPEFGLFDMPFLVMDRAHLKAIDREIVQPELAPKAEKQGVKVLSTWENGFRQITNNVRPIVKPEDLSGLDIRTPSSEWRVKMFTQWGAKPTKMPFSEVFAALQSGLMDGQENPLTNIFGANFHKVQTYLSMTDHVYSPAFLTTGTKTWESLPDDVKVAVMEVAASVQDWALTEGEKADNELIEKIEKSGVQVNRAEKRAFIAASKPVYDVFVEEIPDGHHLIARAQALVLSQMIKRGAFR